MKYELSLIKNPSGTFEFVGSVPIRLAYLSKAGDFVTAEQVKSEMLLPSQYRTIKTRTFASFEAARAAARLLGYEFADKTKS